jgi:hypothetical protein
MEGGGVSWALHINDVFQFRKNATIGNASKGKRCLHPPGSAPRNVFVSALFDVLFSAVTFQVCIQNRYKLNKKYRKIHARNQRDENDIRTKAQLPSAKVRRRKICPLYFVKNSWPYVTEPEGLIYTPVIASGDFLVPMGVAGYISILDSAEP